MILSIDQLINRLQSGAQPDTKPSEALWIRFAQDRTVKTIEYRSASGNEIAHIYLDGQDSLVGIEIFP